MGLTGREMTYAELQKAIQKNSELLKKYPSGPFTPTVLFQLSELYVKKARLDFEKQMQIYEEDLQKYDKGLLKEEPPIPIVNFSDAIGVLYQILTDFPDIPFRDKVLYRIALCHHEGGDREKAVEYFKQLLREFPESPFVPESIFRIGEYYFDRGQYQEAIRYYTRLVDKKMWNNPFFDMALYKLGWSNYKINHYPEAISAFMYLLGDIQVLERTQTHILDRTIVDLKREALDYIAISFSEYDGPEQAKLFLESIDHKGFADDILMKLGEVYLKQDRMDEAIRTMEIFLEFFPDYPKAPQIQKQIVLAYEREWRLEEADKARAALVKNYGPSSLWFKNTQDPEARWEALELVKEALFKMGTYHQFRAREANGDRMEYLTAVQNYRKFLRDFPDDKRAYKVNYFLAECLYALGDYVVAAEEYKKVATNYEEHEYLEDAAYNSILSYYEAIKQNPPSDPETFYVTDFYGSDIPVAIKADNPAIKGFILACQDFTSRLPKSPRATEVMMKEAEVLSSMGRYDLARKIYLTIVKKYPDSAHFPMALMMMGQSYFREENYERAEQWYSVVVQSLPDTTEWVQKAQQMRAFSRYKLAEKFQETGDYLRAAEEFARTAINYPSSDVAERAMFSAAAQFEKLGKKERAAQVYEEFIERYPDSPLFSKAVFMAANLREELGQWDKAAANYLKLQSAGYKEEGDMANLMAEALFAAGKCYLKMADWDEVLNIYQKYLQVSNVPNRYLEALYRVGEAHYHKGNFEEALRAFKRVTSVYFGGTAGDGKGVNPYYAAGALFYTGEIHFKQFKEIKLVPPLARNLEKKKNLLKQVLQDYMEAAKLRLAEWTTAASHRLGEAFETFANDLLDSPPPKGLSPEELDTYREKLKQMAIPFMRKAADAYRANIRQAERSGVDNEWVQRSRVHLLNLKLWLQESDPNYSEESE